MSRVLGEHWALPALDDRNRAFFTAGVLSFQQCADCAHVQHPPEDVCEACRSFSFRVFESAGHGRVESVIVVHHPIHPGMAEVVPYAVVSVAVDDVPGVLVTGNVTNRAPDAIAIGDRVEVTFEEVVDPKTEVRLRIPQWRVVPA